MVQDIPGLLAARIILSRTEEEVISKSSIVDTFELGVPTIVLASQTRTVMGLFS